MGEKIILFASVKSIGLFVKTLRYVCVADFK